MTTTTKVLIAVGVVAVLSVGGYYAWKKFGTSAKAALATAKV